jgi:multidrug transporter EmrE-like cation transporter
LGLEDVNRNKDLLLWLFVLIFYAGNVLFRFAALALIPLSIVAPSSALTIAFNAAFARYYFNESLSLVGWIGTILILGGCAAAVAVGQQHEQHRTMDELMDLFNQRDFIIYSAVSGFIFVLALAYTLRFHMHTVPAVLAALGIDAHAITRDQAADVVIDIDSPPAADGDAAALTYVPSAGATADVEGQHNPVKLGAGDMPNAGVDIVYRKTGSIPTDMLHAIGHSSALSCAAAAAAGSGGLSSPHSLLAPPLSSTSGGSGSGGRPSPLAPPQAHPRARASSTTAGVAALDARPALASKAPLVTDASSSCADANADATTSPGGRASERKYHPLMADISSSALGAAGHAAELEDSEMPSSSCSSSAADADTAPSFAFARGLLLPTAGADADVSSSTVTGSGYPGALLADTTNIFPLGGPATATATAAGAVASPPPQRVAAKPSAAPARTHTAPSATAAAASAETLAAAPPVPLPCPLSAGADPDAAAAIAGGRTPQFVPLRPLVTARIPSGYTVPTGAAAHAHGNGSGPALGDSMADDLAAYAETEAEAVDTFALSGGFGSAGFTGAGFGAGADETAAVGTAAAAAAECDDGDDADAAVFLSSASPVRVPGSSAGVNAGGSAQRPPRHQGRSTARPGPGGGGGSGSGSGAAGAGLGGSVSFTGGLAGSAAATPPRATGTAAGAGTPPGGLSFSASRSFVTAAHAGTGTDAGALDSGAPNSGALMRSASAVSGSPAALVRPRSRTMTVRLTPSPALHARPYPHPASRPPLSPAAAAVAATAGTGTGTGASPAAAARSLAPASPAPSLASAGSGALRPDTRAKRSLSFVDFVEDFVLQLPPSADVLPSSALAGPRASPVLLPPALTTAASAGEAVARGPSASPVLRSASNLSSGAVGVLGLGAGVGQRTRLSVVSRPSPAVTPAPELGPAPALAVVFHLHPQQPTDTAGSGAGASTLQSGLLSFTGTGRTLAPLNTGKGDTAAAETDAETTAVAAAAAAARLQLVLASPVGTADADADPDAYASAEALADGAGADADGADADTDVAMPAHAAMLPAAFVVTQSSGLTKGLLAVSMAYLPAITASWMNLTAKSVMALLKQTVTGKNYFIYFETYLILVGLIISTVITLRFVSQMMKIFEAMLIVPIYQCLFIVGLILVSAFYFDDFSGLSSVNLIVFLVSIGICFVGIFLLTQQKSAPAPEPDEAAVAAAEAEAPVAGPSPARKMHRSSLTLTPRAAGGAAGANADAEARARSRYQHSHPLHEEDEADTSLASGADVEMAIIAPAPVTAV